MDRDQPSTHYLEVPAKALPLTLASRMAPDGANVLVKSLKVHLMYSGLSRLTDDLRASDGIPGAWTLGFAEFICRATADRSGRHGRILPCSFRHYRDRDQVKSMRDTQGMLGPGRVEGQSLTLRDEQATYTGTEDVGRSGRLKLPIRHHSL